MVASKRFAWCGTGTGTGTGSFALIKTAYLQGFSLETRVGGRAVWIHAAPPAPEYLQVQVRPCACVRACVRACVYRCMKNSLAIYPKSWHTLLSPTLYTKINRRHRVAGLSVMPLTRASMRHEMCRGGIAQADPWPCWHRQGPAPPDFLRSFALLAAP